MILGDYLKSRIEPDLRAFADRGSVATDWIRGADGHGELTAIWEQSGQEYPGNHRFRLVDGADGAIQYIEGENEPISYAKFLQKVAELNPISRAMYGNKVHSNDLYVPTKSLMDGQDQPEDSDKMLLKEIGADLKSEQFKTRVFFVKGDAGAGKTTLLERLKVEQAKKFAEGKADFLFLYVSAQGRALSNLDEAIAKELDDLRAVFSHRLRGDGVLALARNGLLVPIVDGFDELLGTQGYGDAFSSLRNFLKRLEGVGVMVVSARSAFYEAEFVQHASSGMGGGQADGARFEVAPVSLLEWEESDLHMFLARSRELPQIAPEDLRQLNALPPQDKDLLKKPFFAARFPEYMDKGNSTGFLEFLANAYIERESHKIVGRDGNPLLQPKHHRHIFVGIAEEMWGSGKNGELRKSDLQTVAELALEKFNLPEDTVAQVREKIGSDAFIRFERMGKQERFLFGHDVYFEYFLSQMIRDKLLEGVLHKERYPSTLNNGVFPAIAVRLAIQDAQTAKDCLRMVDDISQKADLPKENRALNLGQMFATSCALLGKTENTCNNITIRGVIFRDCNFGKAQLCNVRFSECRFNEVNLSDSSMKECVADLCYADGPLIVSSDTRLGVSGFVPGQNVLVIRYRNREGDDRKEEAIGEPQRMNDIFRQLGDNPPEVCFPTYSTKAKGLIQLMKLVVNAFRNASTLCEDDEYENMRKIFRAPAWGDLRKILVDHEMIAGKEQGTNHSNKTRMFLRKRFHSMDEVMRHETTPDANLPDGKIGDFWRTLREIE